MKTNYKQLVNPPYMGAYSMDTGDNSYFEIPAVIKQIKTEMVPDPTGKVKQCLIGITDQPKPFIINSTNQKVLQQISKSRYTEDWVGCHIIFYVALNVRTPQGPTDALRIKPGVDPVIADFSTQERMLIECKTLDDLKVIYSSFSSAQQSATVATKDKMKGKLK